MATGIGYVQNIVALSAAESTKTKMDAGTDGVHRGEQQRKDLQKQVDQKMAEIERLADELKEASDQGFFESVGNWLTGSDGGVGELQDELNTRTAEMKKAQNEILIQQGKIEMMLQELQAAQGELGERLSEREKRYEENEQTTQTAMS